MIASLLLFQIFTETITPQSEGLCVAVSYQGVSYKARKATRYRLTGRVTLVMRDRYPLSGRSILSPTCEEQCAAKVRAAQADCEDRCRRTASGSLLQETLCRDDKCRLLSQPPANCVPDCKEKEKAEIEAEARRWLKERPAPIPGREIQLSGYDAITRDSSCSCSFGAKCVNE